MVRETGVSTGDGQERKRQGAAMRYSNELGERLAVESPELADDRRSAGADVGLIDIARKYLPGISQEFPDVAISAVGKALKTLLPPEERAAIFARLNGEHLMQNLGGRGSETHLQHQRDAALARKKKGVVSDPTPMIEANGHMPWLSGERERLWELSQDPDFQHKKGGIRRVGTLIAEDAARVLNDEFHNGDPTRNIESIHQQMKVLKKDHQGEQGA
jgi:hypothetical protein